MPVAVWWTIALVAAIGGFGVLGWWTGRSSLALIPVLAAVGFQAVLLTSDEVYSRVPEDVQAGATFYLVIAAVAELIGVMIDRASSRRRHPPQPTGPD